jgi:radical SAM enzyme (TIGR01210 family)
MTDLDAWLRDRRSRRPAPKDRGASAGRAVSTWHEKEMLDGREVDALVGILATRGCSHERETGGCTMCGYASDTPPVPPTQEELLAQIEDVASRRGDARWVKLYTSGSMLDPGEVPRPVLEAVVETFGDADMLTVESRSEHVSVERVQALGDPSRREVAIGLESACDGVLAGSVHKGMTFDDFSRAAREVRQAGARLRAYVLLKPPFLTEREAIEDAVKSVLAAAEAGASTVSVNPVSVHGNTLVDYLHHRGEYEPPWLWSVSEVLQRAASTLPEGVRVVSAPTGGGKTRGAHNCGRCDPMVLKAIEFHRMSGDPRDLEGAPSCDCRARWEAQLELEGLMQGPFAPRDYRR